MDKDTWKYACSYGRSDKWLKTHIPNNNLYDVLWLKTVEECHANLPSKMILARYFYTITEMCVSSIAG